MGLDCYLGLTPTETPTTLIPDAASLARTVTTVLPAAQWYPPAIRRQLDRDMGGVLSVSRGLVLHVEAGNNSPWGWFNRDDVKASSHWWVSKTGIVEQYVPAGRVAWAQAGGNGAWHSVETEGWPNEYLTAAQLDALGALYRWGSAHWGWPLKLAEKPDQFGLGWHGMGGTAWGNHPGCPGNLRLHQRAAVLVHAQAPATPPPEEDDVELTEDNLNDIGAASAAATVALLQSQAWDTDSPPKQDHVGAMFRRDYEMTGATLAAVSRIEKAVTAPLVPFGDVTEAAIHHALDHAVDVAALARIVEHGGRALSALLTRPPVLPPSEA